MSHSEPSGLIRRATRYLAAHGVHSPGPDAEAIILHVLGTDRATMYTRAAPLTAEQVRAVGRGLCQRAGGTPLQHITGEQQFMDLTLAVAPGVFVPRPETEGLVVAALDVLDRVSSSGPVVVDVGTGTGAVALALKRARPAARVLASDVSAEAVALARSNAAAAECDVEILAGDLLAPVPGELRGRIDLIVSNPPYIAREDYDALPREVQADPYGALVGGTDVHRRLVAAGAGWLRPGGWLVVEIGQDQADDVRELFGARFVDVEVVADLAGRDRIVRGRLPP